jgi:hypothetical protein
LEKFEEIIIGILIKRKIIYLKHEFQIREERYGEARLLNLNRYGFFWRR